MICSLYQYLRIAVWWALVLVTIHANASDIDALSCSAAADRGNPTSVATAVRISPETKRQRRKLSKYDVNRIGQRNIGNGINLYSMLKERAIGAAMATAIDAQATPVTDPKIRDYIGQLAQKIVRKSDAQFPFTVKIIDSKNPTIFSLPGGFLYVDVGLIRDLDNEAELAGLIAHEVAHVAARHATRLATRRYALDTLFTFPIERLVGPIAIAVRQIGLVPVEKKFNRQSVFEADLLGIEYQYAAGYDPQAYLDSLERLGGTDTQPGTLSSHQPSSSDFMDRLNRSLARAYADYPSTESRISRLQTEISELLPCRSDYVVDTSEFQEIKAQLLRGSLVLRRHREGDGDNKGPVLLRPPVSD